MMKLLILPLLLPLLVSAQGQIIWTDSVALPGAPLLGSNLSTGVILNTQKITPYGPAGFASPVDLTQLSPQANARTATQAGDVYYVLDYPDQILRINFQTGQHDKLRLVTRHKGVDYDMFTPTVNSAAFIPALNALAYYVVPIGTEAKNLFTDVSLYRDYGMIGIFSIQGKKVVLTDVIGARDSLYMTRALLPHLHHVTLTGDSVEEALYVGQSATPEIQHLSVSGEVLARFGHRSSLTATDTIIPIPPGIYTRRREAGYGMLATHYQYLYLDTRHQRLYRTYRIGERVPLQEDSIAIQPPRPSNAVCRYDAYLNVMTAQRAALPHGLQVYDLAQSPPALIMDVPIQQQYEVVATPSDREVIVCSFQNHTYWLRSGVVECAR